MTHKFTPPTTFPNECIDEGGGVMTNRGDHMKAKAMANDFLVWREASSVDWDCTIAELAEATGLEASTVGKILKGKGWRDRVLDGNKATFYRLPVDTAMIEGLSSRVMGRF